MNQNFEKLFVNLFAHSNRLFFITFLFVVVLLLSSAIALFLRKLHQLILISYILKIWFILVQLFIFLNYFLWFLTSWGFWTLLLIFMKFWKFAFFIFIFYIFSLMIIFWTFDILLLCLILAKILLFSGLINAWYKFIKIF